MKILKVQKKAKQTKDFEKGRDNRELAVARMNIVLAPVGLKFRRVHEYLKTFSLTELKEHNILVNRIYETGMMKAVGLDYILTAEHTSETKVCAIRFPTWDTYYKLASDSVGEWEFIVQKIINNFVFICADGPEFTKFWMRKGCEFKWGKNKTNRIYALQHNYTALAPKNVPFTNIEGNTGGLFTSNLSFQQSCLSLFN